MTDQETSLKDFVRHNASRAILGVGHFLTRSRFFGRVAEPLARQALCGATNARHYNMSRNGEGWLIGELAEKLAGRTVIDAGANHGHWTAHVLKAAPTANLYAVEMIPDFAAELRRRFGDRVTVVEDCLSDCRETVIAYKVGGGGRIPNVPDPKKITPFNLQTRTGDDLAAEYGLTDIAMIKIDVDGYDIKVLRGFSNVIAEQRPVIQFEYSAFYVYTRTFLKDAYDFFEPLGYRVGRLMPNRIEFREYTGNMDNALTNNYVAVPLPP